MQHKMKRALYIFLGCVGVALGALGAVLPLLPAFPFLVLAAFSFGKSSPRLNAWFLNSKLYKTNLEPFLNGRGMTPKTKVRVMLAITVLMSIGFYFLGRFPVGRPILVAVWLFHMWYFAFRVKAFAPEEESPAAEAGTLPVCSGT